MKDKKYYVGVTKDMKSVTEYGWVYVRAEPEKLSNLKEKESALYDDLSNSFTQPHKLSDIAEITEDEYNTILNKNIAGEEYNNLLEQIIAVALARKKRETVFYYAN